MRARLWAHMPLVALLFCLPSGSALAAPSFAVKDARLRLQQDTYYLDADIAYDFSEAALEALNNGVPLTLVVRVELLRDRKLIWNEEIARLKLRYQLRYHALAQLFQVLRVDTGVHKNYASRSAAIRALGTVRDLPLAERGDLRPDQRYFARIRADLDIEALPLPLRPLAYISPSWYLASEWFTWRLDH